MNQVTRQDEEQILEVMNLLGPGLQQAIANGIVEAQIRLGLDPDLEQPLQTLEQQPLPMPHPDFMPRLLWASVYAEYIGANTSSGQLDYDPAMLHDNATFHAEMAFNAFKKRFPE